MSEERPAAFQRALNHFFFFSFFSNSALHIPSNSIISEAITHLKKLAERRLGIEYWNRDSSTDKQTDCLIHI